MPQKRPAQVYSFTDFSRRTPTAQHPGDRLDAQFREHAHAIADLQQAVEAIERIPKLDIQKLADEILARIGRAADDAGAAATTAGTLAREASLSANAASFSAASALHQAQRLNLVVDHALDEIDARTQAMRQTNLELIDAKDAVDNSANDALLAAATAQDWAQVSIDWAEHLPDPIPPNTLAWTGVSGQHWSSRWWALRSANAFGMLAWAYLGAWPYPGPPSTPYTPTGDQIPTGAMYWDTTLNSMMVWNGSSWVNVSSPSKASTSSLYYLSVAGQTVFPFSVVDRNGKTFAFSQTATEGLQAFVNGVRLEPTYDFTVNTVASSVTFLRPLPAGALVIFDILASAATLAPVGSSSMVLLTPIVPDGVKTTFTGLTVLSNGHAVNTVRSEELHVSVDGVLQAPAGAYTASGAQITFTEAPPADANIFIVWYGPVNP